MFRGFGIIDSVLGFIEKWYRVILIIIFVVGAFNLFYNLGEFPIYSWDEARHGVNAYEMIKNNNYIVNTYAYKNDYWNLKPPVSYWTIILGYRLAGYNPLGLRVISAAAGLITIVLATAYSCYAGGRLASVISGAVLASTSTFILEHCARTGDADSIFVLFFTCSILSLSLSLRNRRWLYSYGIFFALAFLTKSWHAGNIAVIGIIFALLKRKELKLKRKDFFSAIAGGAVPILIWVVLRCMQDGINFFKTMIGYDLISRTSRTLEGHIGSIYYYFEHFQWSYFYWFIVFTAGVTGFLVLNRVERDKRVNALLTAFIWIIVPFILYSIAKTKISWYVLPLYPAMAIVTGLTTSELLKYKKKNIGLQMLVVFMLSLAFIRNETDIIQKISNPTKEQGQELIKSLQTMEGIRGREIYIHHYEQSYFLSAELYLDLIPREGGIDAFLKDTNSPLLFVAKDNKEINKLDFRKLRIIAENKMAYIISK
jgi:4-amino-4-deoxy-L-arabinose transferase-like glycosyltransferase